MSWGSPDLSVKVGDARWFVECYTYQKSFGLVAFLRELLLKIDHPDCDVDISRSLCVPFTLPSGKDRTQFLDEILSPFLDSSYLKNVKEEAKRKGPKVLYEDPCSSLRVYVKGSSVDENFNDALGLSVLDPETGDPAAYLRVAIREAFCAKRYKNKLNECHPNLLAVNFLLSDDWHASGMLSLARLESVTLPEIEPNIDALAVSGFGIDKPLTSESLKVAIRSDDVDRKHLDHLAVEYESGPKIQESGALHPEFINWLIGGSEG